MPNDRYRLLVAAPGAGTPTSGTAEFITADSAFRSIPTVNHPRILPLQGKVEAFPWSVDVLDVGGAVTATFADSSGRLNALNRIVLLQRNRDSAGYVTLAGGRVADVNLWDDVAGYTITVEDERRLDRNLTLFDSSNTTRLYPGSPHKIYGPFYPHGGGIGQVVARQGTKLACVSFADGYPRLSPLVIQRIEADLTINASTGSTVGNFGYVKLRIGTSTYPVFSFGVNPISSAGIGTPDRDFTVGLNEHRTGGQPLRVWVNATTSQLALNASISSAFLHMFAAPAHPAIPLHIGTSAGLHPAQVLQNVLVGTYTLSSAAVLSRYSTSAIQTLLNTPMPKVRYRITQPAGMAEWLENEILGPFNIAPFPQADGTVAYKSVALPATSSGITFSFTGANLRAPHPTWQHTQRDLVTVLNVTYSNEAPAVTGGAYFYPFLALTTGGADLIQAYPGDSQLVHDRADKLGRVPVDIKANGVHYTNMGRNVPGYTPAPDYSGAVLQSYLGYIRNEFFNRFGDGPVWGTLHGMSTCESVAAGDFVKVTLGTYPNPSTGGRGGTRIVQVTSKSLTADGPTFTYLDAGPNLQALTSPTLVLSTSTSDPKHQLKVTVGGTFANRDAFDLQLARNTTRPAATSQLWLQRFAAGSTGTYTLSFLASGLTHHARIRKTHRARIPSPWVYSSVGKVTASITAPNITGVSGIGARQATLAWTPGDMNYQTDVHIDATTSASLSTGNYLATLPKGTKSYVLQGLTSGSVKHRTYIRHRDQYGGFSASDSTTFTTSTSLNVAPNITGIAINYGAT